MNASIGIDIGKKKCVYCIVNGKGTVVERGEYLNTPQDAGEFAQKMARRYLKRGTCRAACETTANMWVTTIRAFETAGIEIKLASASQMPLIAKTAKKTDKVDSEKIAQILRMNMIPECHVPPAGVRGLRCVIRQRIRLTRDRTRVINRVHGLLDAHGVRATVQRMYAAKSLKWLKTLVLSTEHDTFVLRQSAREITYLTNEITEIERRLEAEAAANEDARLLASMTGIGIYSALLLAAEIDGIERFQNPKKIVSWAGLCPHIKQSSESGKMNYIKKRDRSKLVNWIMCEAANTAAHHDPKMAAIYESARRRHAGRHGPAVVVVAHKMITIMWHMLSTRTPYESRKQELYDRKLSKMRKARQRR